MNDADARLDAALLLLQNLASNEWDQFSYTYDDWMGRRAMFYAEIAEFANDARLRLRRMIEEEQRFVSASNDDIPWGEA